MRHFMWWAGEKLVYETPICLQSKEFDLCFTANKEVTVLMQARLKNS